MASCNILFIYILVCFLSYATTEAQGELVNLNRSCSSDRTTTNSTFQINLRTLFSSLSSNATGETEFYNTTVTGSRDPSDSVYGLFMCRGDVSSQLCQQCVFNATQRLSSECTLSKQAVIWYDECMVRYSNRSFFSTVDTWPTYTTWSTYNISNTESFSSLLFSVMNVIADESAYSPMGDHKKFATRDATLSAFETLYCLAQCTPDLSPDDCRQCLREAIGELPSCCGGKRGGRFLYPSCNVRYEVYPFYSSTVPPPMPAPALVPATNASQTDSKVSEDPVYLSHNCSTNKTFTDKSTFQSHLTTLLSYLSSNSTSGDIFYKEDVNNTVHGLFMCRGDVPSDLCGQCVQNATRRISSDCRSFQEAIIWYSHCMLRYSYRNFFTKIETNPNFLELNISNTSSPSQERNLFIENKLDELAIAGDSAKKYATKSLKLNDQQTLYSLGQCTQDLSSDDCKVCLSDMIGTAIPWSRLGSVGGRVLYPSCNMRFELFQFYRDDNEQGRSGPTGEVLTQVLFAFSRCTSTHLT